MHKKTKQYGIYRVSHRDAANVLILFTNFVVSTVLLSLCYNYFCDAVNVLPTLLKPKCCRHCAAAQYVSQSSSHCTTASEQQSMCLLHSVAAAVNQPLCCIYCSSATVLQLIYVMYMCLPGK